MQNNFALIGAAGYIAPRHLKAIKETGNQLLAAYDPCDSVGVLDRYFPEAAFFTEFERFERHIEKQNRNGQKINYVSVCSPNYLHDSHVRFALRNGASVICEKPLVLNPWNAETLVALEKESEKKINALLQLRLHPAVVALKQRVVSEPNEKYDIELTYITPRGSWYYTSWKGEQSKSGGIATNIGIHFFDMLIWLFGAVKNSLVHQHTHDRAAGFLEFSNARVKWFLSIDAATLPEEERRKDNAMFRSIVVNGEEIDFTNGFEDLHTKSYEQILSGNGFGVTDALPGIQLAHDIRHATIEQAKGEYHPLIRLPQAQHPFLKK